MIRVSSGNGCGRDVDDSIIKTDFVIVVVVVVVVVAK